jgi:hypothetical protein
LSVEISGLVALHCSTAVRFSMMLRIAALVVSLMPSSW